MSASIRKAVAGDLERIAEIESASFSADSFNRRQLRYLVTRARGALFVALREGEITGYISILTRNGGHGRIYSLVVDPAQRGKGVAGALLEHGLKYLADGGFKKVFLEVRPDNAGAIALYAKKGFVRRSVKPDYYHDGTEALSMFLFLGL